MIFNELYIQFVYSMNQNNSHKYLYFLKVKSPCLRKGYMAAHCSTIIGRGPMWG